jgi:hypothetical protein
MTNETIPAGTEVTLHGAEPVVPDPTANPVSEPQQPIAPPVKAADVDETANRPTTRCKFRVTARTAGENRTLHVAAHPVTDGSEENKTFWEYTPAGLLSLTVTRPEVLAAFDTGVEFYVDLTPIK